MITLMAAFKTVITEVGGTRMIHLRCLRRTNTAQIEAQMLRLFQIFLILFFKYNLTF